MTISKLKLLVIFLFLAASAFAQTSSCNTWTFRLQLSSSRSEDPSDVIAVPGGYVVTGSDSSAAGVFGRIIKLGMNGHVVLSKEVNDGSANVRLKKLILSGGELYVLGQTENNTGIITPLLMKLDTSTLNIISAVTLDPSPGSWHPATMNEGAGNTMNILSSNDSMINVTRLDANGTILWSKSYKTGNTPVPVGIVNGFPYNYVVYNITEGGLHKGAVLSLDDQGTEKAVITIGGGPANSQFILQSVHLVLGLLYITGARTAGGKTSPVRLTVASYNLNLNSTEDFSFGSFVPGPSLIAVHSDWSEMIATANPNSSDVYLGITFPLNYQTPIRGKKVSYPYPVTLRNIIRTSDDGSLLLGKGEGSMGKIVITKVDSAGALPVCGNDTVAASFTLDHPQRSDGITLPVSDETVQADPAPVTITDLALSPEVDCRSLSCPVVPEPPVCQRTFFKRYDNLSHSAFPRQILNAGSGKLLLVADYRANPYIADDVTSLSLVDTAGKVLGSKDFNGNDSISMDGVTRLRDGSYIGVGEIQINSVSPAALGIIKLDANLNIQWQKKLNFSRPYNGFFDIIESSEGDFYCYPRDVFTNIPEKRQLLKLDHSGNAVWFKEYDAGPSVFPGTDQREGHLLDLGNYIYMDYHPENDWSPHILKISKSDGSIVWDRQYELTEILGSAFNQEVTSFFTDSIYLYMSVRQGTENALLKIDPAGGNLVKSFNKTSPQSLSITKMVYAGKGKLVLSTSGPAVTQYGIIQMDTSFHVLQKQFVQVPAYGAIYDLTNYDDSINFGLGAGSYPGNSYEYYLTLQKYNFESSFASCQLTNPQVTFGPVNVTVTDGGATASDLPLPGDGVVNVAASAGSLTYSAYFCGDQPLCSSVKVSGPSSLCDSGTYHYSANRNPGCEAHINWVMNAPPDSVEMLNVTDTSVDLWVKKGGRYQLAAKIFGSCSWVGDSMEITAAMQAHQSLNLGPDTTLCPGGSIKLVAGSGFSGYAWQDASSDTSFTVTSPGTYFVTVQAGCSRELSDTVVVSPHPAIPFDLGPDTSICRGEPITLTAPAGFSHYQWTPGNDSVMSITVGPWEGTLYKASAQGDAGCMVSDSLFVGVKSRPVITLPADTSFCEGEAITLDPGAGFDTYDWNTGDSSRKITANSEGIYSVTVSLNGCSSSDSMKVLNVFRKPSFSLGDDSTLCEGQGISYSFSLPGASYLWSTGNATGNYAITSAGTYWLQVTQQGCNTSDTVTITYQPSPVVNLGNDTTICEGTSLTLSAYNPNASYIWQDGSSASSFKATSTGTYSVTALINGCSSQDSIHIQVTPLPKFTLGEDQYICSGQQVLLQPAVNTDLSYLWQDGSNAPSFLVIQKGTYHLTAKNECGSYSDSVTIKEGFCGLYIPNAFTPNGDGLNDVFRLKYSSPLQSFHLQVYDRFGEKVFESFDVQKGWDGTFRGVDAVAGVYTWTLGIVTSDGSVENRKGIVTLLR